MSDLGTPPPLVSKVIKQLQCLDHGKPTSYFPIPPTLPGGTVDMGKLLFPCSSSKTIILSHGKMKPTSFHGLFLHGYLSPALSEQGCSTVMGPGGIRD